MAKATMTADAALVFVTPKLTSAQLRASAKRPDVAALLNRVRSEFCEMPGMALTLAQASRLFGLAEADCLRLFQELLDSGSLYVRHDGRYAVKVAAA